MNFKALMLSMAACYCMQARVAAAQSDSSIPIAIRAVATNAHETKTSATFWMKGGAADAALPLGRAFSAAIEAAGTTVSRVPNTTRGLSTITLLAGPRFTVPTHRVSYAAQALFGAVRGFDADFTTGTHRTDTATAFAFSVGGFIDLPLSRTISLRAAQVDYLQTFLPNEADNRQGNLRVAAGVVFHVRLPAR